MEQPDTGQRLATLEEWALSIDRRVLSLENEHNVIMEVRLALERLTMSNNHVTEKLEALQKSVDKISTDNQKQHDELSARIGTIEKAPAGKWENLKTVVIASTITAIIGAVLAILLT